jgi:inorganic pyrophosphatase
MDISKISIGEDPPRDVNVLIEIPQGGVPVKYELDKESGALLMKDEAGDDEKVIAVPVDKLHPFYEGVKSYRDLPVTLTDQIAHFFQHYKDLEKGKWVTIVNWVGTDRAEKMIVEGIRRAAAAGDDVAAHHVASGALKSRRKKK